jgi:hypothetical protein
MAAARGGASSWRRALLGVWATWGCLARLAVYACTDMARLEVERAVHPLETLVDGCIVTTHMALGQEGQEGEALVELAAETQRLQREEEHTRLAALTPQLKMCHAEAGVLTGRGHALQCQPPLLCRHRTV